MAGHLIQQLVDQGARFKVVRIDGELAVLVSVDGRVGRFPVTYYGGVELVSLTTAEEEDLLLRDPHIAHPDHRKEDAPMMAMSTCRKVSHRTRQAAEAAMREYVERVVYIEGRGPMGYPGV